jgi:thiol reductant ABC exporter CydC subunit
MSWARQSTAVAAGVAGAACAIGLVGVASWLIATAATHPALSVLAVAIVAVRACGVGRGPLRYAERLAGHDAVLRTLGEVRARAFARLAELAPAGLPELRAGDLTTRLVSDVDATADATLRLRLPARVAAAVGALAVLGAALLLPPVAVALAAALAVMALGGPAIARRVAARDREFVAARRGEYASALAQTLHAAPDLIAFDAVGPALDRLDRADRAVSRAANSTAWRQGLAAAIGVAAGGAAPVAALLFGIPAVRSGSLGSAWLAVAVLAPLAVYEVFAPLPLAAALRDDFAAARARLADIESRPAPIAEPVAPQPPPGAYDLEVDRLAAGWPPIGAPRSRPEVAFSNVSFRVASGQRVAVVGPSGSGKSTLAATLVRFLDPSDGAARIGGVDIRDMRADDVQALVGLCAQDAYIFDSDIAENVRLARPDADDAQVRQALDRAGLGDWVATLPDGVATRVGEHGAALSGGQRQRLALARVLLADRPIVILDEPTEHVDEPTADALISDLLDRSGGRTVILLTHRHRDLEFVDEVVELQASSISASRH